MIFHETDFTDTGSRSWWTCWRCPRSQGLNLVAGWLWNGWIYGFYMDLSCLWWVVFGKNIVKMRFLTDRWYPTFWHSHIPNCGWLGQIYEVCRASWSCPRSNSKGAEASVLMHKWWFWLLQSCHVSADRGPHAGGSTRLWQDHAGASCCQRDQGPSEAGRSGRCWKFFPPPHFTVETSKISDFQGSNMKEILS